MDRAHVDDASEAAPAHARQRGAREHGAAGQHHGDEDLPAFARELLQRCDMLQPGIVDQQVRPLRLQRGDCGIDALLRGDVETQRRRDESAGAQVGRGTRRGGGIEVRQAHRAAAFGEVCGDAQADAARGSGDQHP